MAAKTANPELAKLKADIAAKTPARLYLFYGEETYLKEHYLGALRTLAAEDGFADFSIVELDGGGLSLDALTDAVDSVPFGALRKLVVIRDYKLFQPSGALKDALPELLAQLPDYLTLVFDFATVEFKPDKRLSLWKLIEKYAEVVEFRRADLTDLAPWIRRRFSALGKDIDRAECEYLVFLCGSLMTGLTTEIEKIAAGTRAKQITRQDIDRLASRAIEAQVFDLTDRFTKGQTEQALAVLQDLFATKTEEVVILSVLAKHFQRLYAARLIWERHGGESEVMRICGLRSAYPARLLLQEASRVSLPQLRRAVTLCADTDLELKSSLPDPQRILSMLVLRLALGTAR